MRNDTNKSNFKVTYTRTNSDKPPVTEASIQNANSLSSQVKTSSLEQLQYEKYRFCCLAQEAYLQAYKRKEGDKESQLELTEKRNSIMLGLELVIFELYDQIELLQKEIKKMDDLAVASSDVATCEQKQKLKEELDAACNDYYATCSSFRYQFSQMRMFHENHKDSVFSLKKIDSNAQQTTQQNAL